MTTTVQPITNKERIRSIDIIRGIALIGIVFTNATSYLTITDGRNFPSHPLDSYLGFFNYIFIQTKFYCIFSFLFGLGFYIFMNRAEERKAKIYLLFSRRLFAMLLIGLLHFYIWEGSILPYYAVLGFFLMLFYKRKPRTILAGAFGLIGLNIISTGVETLQILFGWSIWEFFSISCALLAHDVIATFAMFLLGLYVGKRNIIVQVQNCTQLLRRIQVISLFLSIIPVIKLVYSLYVYVPGLRGQLIDVFTRIGTYSLSFFYLSSLFLLLQNKTLSNALKPIANMGKVALTVYVCQNLLGSLLIFLFGWSAGYTLVQSFVIAVLIIIIQLIGSNLYVMKFKQGPMEIIWRKMTYGFKVRAAKGDINTTL